MNDGRVLACGLGCRRLVLVSLMTIHVWWWHGGPWVDR